MTTTATVEVDGEVIGEFDAETMMSMDVEDQFPGMPEPTDMVEVTLAGKDGWFNPPKPHDEIHVGMTIHLRVRAYVSAVGTKESGKEDVGPVPFVKLKTEIIDTGDDTERSFRAFRQ